MKIGRHEIKNFGKPFIIAEIGANHNGDIELAKKMIDIAKEKGADCVKFQSWSKDSIFSRVVYDENYFLADDYRQRTDYNLEEIVDAFSIGREEHRILKAYCDEKDIVFASTPFCKEEVDFLVDELDVEFIKVASMDLNNLPFIEYIAKKNKPIFLSTGLATMAEIDEAVATIEKAGNKQLVILHCISLYPPEDHMTNLNNIDMLRDYFGYLTGYSDHTLGTTVALLSAAKGACVIEKHFTLDKEMFGWDHKVSANPEELEMIIKETKRTHTLLGNYKRVVNESQERKDAFRRSIVAKRPIKKGEVIQFEDLDFKRPGYGIEPKHWKFVVGKKAKIDIAFDMIISNEHI